MTDETKPVQPVYPPIDATKGVPPLTPYNAWTWTTPVLPQIYWNVYSSEQRIRQICTEIGKIQAYLSYFASNSNAAHWYLDERFTETETRLTKRIDALETELRTETARLDALIAAETSAREQADTEINTHIKQTDQNLEAETERAQQAEQTNADAIAAETSAREQADTEINTHINQTDTNLEAETKRAQQAEQANADAITAETSAREQADTEINTHINQTDQNLEAETERAKAAETGLTDTLAAETARAKQAEQANTSAINANKTSGEEADKRLQDSIDTEIANRKNGDNALSERIDVETNARTQIDTNLNQQIATETSNRRTADNQIRALVYARPAASHITSAPDSHIKVTTTESTTDPNVTTVEIGDTFTPDFERLETGLSAETERAQSVENALAGKIAHETNDRETADNTLTQAINERLKASSIIAGSNITVTPDPDSTTVTISAPDAGGLTTVAHDYSLTGDGTTDTPLTVNQTYVAYQTDVNTEANRAKSAETELKNIINTKIGLDALIAGDNVRIQKTDTTATISADSGIKEIYVTSGQITGNGTKSRPLGINGNYAVNTYVDTKINPQQILAGDNITITRSEVGSQTPSVTISATGGGGGLAEVEVDSPLEGDGTSSNPIGFSESELNSYLQNLDVIRDLQTEDTSLNSRLSSVETTLPTKIAAVQHDDTLTGNGTSDSNLKVNLNHNTVMSDTGNTVYPTLIHASEDESTINGIGFNAGSGLTAYNSDDADIGSGLRLSDAALASLTNADNALQKANLIGGTGIKIASSSDSNDVTFTTTALLRVTTNRSVFTGDGTSTDPLSLNQSYLQTLATASVTQKWMQTYKFELATAQWDSGDYDLARMFSASGTVSYNLAEISNDAPEYGAQLGIIELQTDEGEAVVPVASNFNYVRLTFTQNAYQATLPSTLIMNFSPIKGTSSTNYQIKMQDGAYKDTRISYSIASSGTSSSIPIGVYAVTLYTA